MSNIVAFCTAHVYSAFSCFFCCSPATIDSIGQSSHVHLSHDPQTTMEATRGLKSSQTGYIGTYYRLEKEKNVNENSRLKRFGYRSLPSSP